MSELENPQLKELKKKKKKKKTPKIESEVENAPEEKKIKKKKKKKLSTESTEQENTKVEQSEESVAPTEVAKKKKKKSKKIAEQSQSEAAKSQGSDNAEVKEKPKKKKKKKSKFDADTKEEKSSGDKEAEVKKEKKKKKRKSSSEENQITSAKKMKVDEAKTSIVNNCNTTTEDISNKPAKNEPCATIEDHWSSAFNKSSQQQSKFMRLMGGSKKGIPPNKNKLWGGGNGSKVGTNRKNTNVNQMNRQLADQFEKARNLRLARLNSGGQGFTSGLGFNHDSLKSSYIDPHKKNENSVIFNDSD